MSPLLIRFLCLSGNMTEATAFAIATNLNTCMQFGYVAEFENARALFHASALVSQAHISS